MQPEIASVQFERKVLGYSLHRAIGTTTITAGSLGSMRGVYIKTRSGNVFVPETNVLEVHLAEPQEPAPASIQETKQRGSQRSGHRTT